MKITAVKTLITCPKQNYVFVKILTDEPGLYGWGEASLNGRDKAVADLIDEYLAPMLIGWDPDKQVEQVIRYFIQIRELVGPEIGLCYDLHSRFSPAEAIYIIRALEPYRPFFLEDPVAPDCLDSLRTVREKTAAPLAFGELYKSRWECLPMLTGRLADFLRADIVRVGGITELRKINAIAETYDIKTAWHGSNDLSPLTQAVNWHLNVSSYNFGIQEFGDVNPQIGEIVRGGPVYREGYLYMHEDRPGIGVEIDEDAAARYPYIRAYIPYCRRASDNSIVDW